ncbi:FecR family protein [Filimonas lacunae]|uniref:FecR family protein n=1 Tax=Filimonas lacunae TaxID=477680 RepID=A0A173MJR0_9BACT|nr:FecR domain-containing protein [Filimonas lacunae]BAV07873.1 anti-sigma factor [Filimonas lacunae]SIT05873.1 FecR family protein [Filimonas lacunae]
MANSERITFLLKAFSSQTASIAEEKELLDWLNNTDNHELVLDHIRLLLDEAAATPEAFGVDWDHLYQKILLQRNSLEAPAVTTISIYKRIRRYSAAAAMIAVMAASAWLLLRNNNKEIIPAKPVAHSTPLSTGSKIELTLSYGQIVVLDSMMEGLIRDEATGEMISVHHGSLTYSPDSKSTSAAHFHQITVPRGKQYHVVLPDGSGVWLNAQSSLRYQSAFTNNRRQVTLSGEAYFEIKNNPTAPFSVNANEVHVDVLGTAFNMMAYKDEQKVVTTLVNGSVKVSAADAVIIKPGQQAVLQNGKHHFAVSTADLDAVLAWKSGEFRFDGLDIKGVMRQVARWYNVEVVYKGNLPNNKLYGVFPRKNSVKEVLEALVLISNIQLTMEGNTITVQPGKNHS